MRTREGYQDTVSSKHRASGLNLVSRIELYTANSSYIDAILVWFASGQVERLGTPNGESMGKQVASIAFAPNDRVTEVFIWTDSSLMRVQGVAMKLASGARLDGGQGRRATEAQVQLDQPGDLGSGLLLGVAAAAKPGDKVLSAVAFAFLKPPVSSAMAVDMPSIDIEAAAFKPRADVRFKTANNGSSSSTVTGGCVGFSQTITTTTVYSGATDVQRLASLIASIGDPRLTKAASYKTTVSLQASEQQVLVTGERVVNTWSDQVRQKICGHVHADHVPACVHSDPNPGRRRCMIFLMAIAC